MKDIISTIFDITVFDLLTGDDKEKISSISGFDCDKLIYEITNSNELDFKSQFFSNDNLCENYNFNKKGVQVLRYILGERIFEDRRKNSGLNNSEYHQEYSENGCIILNNFLDDNVFSQIEQRFSEIKSRIVANNLDSHNTGFYINLEMYNNKFRHLTSYLYGIEGFSYPNVELCCLKHPKMDEQRDLHFDKWFPNFKLWYIPEDTTMEHGPLNIVKGSHQIKLNRLRWIYNQSLLCTSDLNYFDDQEYNLYFAHRFFPGKNTNESLKKYEFNEETACTFSKNTLIIFDTRCFHRRGMVSGGQYRYSFRSVFPRSEVFQNKIMENQ